MDQSVKEIAPSRWSIGSLVCERTNTNTTQHVNAVAAWEEDEYTYILRKAKDDEIAPSTTFADPSSDTDFRLAHTGGTLSALWTIGRGVFCKAKSWDPKMEPEDETIAFVKKIAPQISTPEVIHACVEHDRSFLILRRMEGSTLRDVWASLSLSQRQSVVETIATYCDLLAQNTSKTLGTATGRPVFEPYLSLTDSFVGLLAQNECERYFSVSSEECPTIGEDFHFYHPDLGPSNIMISKDGKVAGILDWESAGYYPAFWIATKPAVSPAFNFDPQVPEHEEHEWRKRLRDELERLGYPQMGEWYMKWFRSRSRT